MGILTTGLAGYISPRTKQFMWLGVKSRILMLFPCAFPPCRRIFHHFFDPRNKVRRRFPRCLLGSFFLFYSFLGSGTSTARASLRSSIPLALTAKERLVCSYLLKRCVKKCISSTPRILERLLLKLFQWLFNFLAKKRNKPADNLLRSRVLDWPFRSV